MFPSCITQVECAAFLLIVIQEDRLLSILVLEVAAIHAREGLLVNLRRSTASFSVMIGDLKQRLVPHHILQRHVQPHERAEQEYTPCSMRRQHSYERCLLLINPFVGSTHGKPAMASSGMHPLILLLLIQGAHLDQVGAGELVALTIAHRN